MRGRRLLIVSLGVLLVAGVAGGVWYYNYRQSPAYALGQLREAVEEKNALKFERYAQVGHFAEAFVDDVLSVTAEEAFADAGNEGGWAALGRALGMSMIEKVKPAAVSMAESAIREAIETGRADSIIREASVQKGEVNLSRMADAAAIDPDGYRGMTEIREEGDVATVGFRFYNAAYDTTITFRVKMEQKDDRWQVTEPYDLGRLLRAVSTRKDSLLARANRTMQAEAEELVQFGELKRWTSTPCRFCSDNLHVALAVTNTSEDTLDFVAVTLNSYGESLDDGDFRLVSLSDIAPSETRTLDRELDYNQFLDWHETLRHGSVTPQVQMLVYRGTGTGGARYVAQLKSLEDLKRFRQRESGPGVFIPDTTAAEADTATAEESTLDEVLSENP